MTDFIAEKFEEFLKKIDFEKLSAEGKNRLQKILHEIPQESKAKTLQWLEQVEEIKNETELSEEDKRLRMEDLETTDIILSLFRSIAELCVEEIPIKNKDFLKTGLITTGTLFSIVQFKFSAITAIVVKKALPSFLLSASSNKMLHFLKAHLSENVEKVS